MSTSYFTFGFDHLHRVDGVTYDTNTVVRVTAPDPRAVMLDMFGREWAFEYPEGRGLDLDRWPLDTVVVELPA